MSTSAPADHKTPSTAVDRDGHVTQHHTASNDHMLVVEGLSHSVELIKVFLSTRATV